METVVHLFWQCPVTQTFINNLRRELLTKYQIRFNLRKQDWFFPQETDQLQTLLITLTKSAIYKARNTGRKPELSHVLQLLKIEAQKEQLACRLKNKPENFEKKWKTLKQILS